MGTRIIGVLRRVRNIFQSQVVKRPLETLGLWPFLRSKYWDLYELALPSVRSYDIVGETIQLKASNHEEFNVEALLFRERKMMEDIVSNLRPGDVFYDIGANIGLFTLVAAAAGDNIKPVAFEPHPANFDRLVENLELNDVQADTYRLALSDDKGVVNFAVRSSRSGSTHNTIVRDESTQSLDNMTEVITVDAISGDGIRTSESLPSPDIIKIDVEGAEMDVLNGLESTLQSSDCRMIYCEVHQNYLADFGATESDLRSYLERLGYTIEILGGEEHNHDLLAVYND